MAYVHHLRAQAVDEPSPARAETDPAIAPGPEAKGPLSQSADGSKRHLLVLQFALVNLTAFALVAAAHVQGWLWLVVDGDRTGLTVAIALVFLGGLAFCTHKIWRISTEVDCTRNFDPCHRSWAATYLAEVSERGAGSRAITGSALRVRIASYIAVVRHFANSLVVLGLIGTVLGFIIAMSGVDPSAATNVQAVGPMVSELISGMSVALYTTLVGAILNVWLMVNYHILARGATTLVTDLVALGESNARSRSD